MAQVTEETAVARREPPQAQPVLPPAELSVDEVVRQVVKIQEAMRHVMQKDVHYGVIPGTQKPSLLQPGAEKLCVLFRLASDYTVECQRDASAERPWEKKDRSGKVYAKGTCKGFVRYTVICRLTHGPTGMCVSAGAGTANNWEPKFISRDPYEVEETILQFARKRALVNAVRTGTAASDIFTQDVEDVPRESFEADAAPRNTHTPRTAPAPAATPTAGKPQPAPSPSSSSGILLAADYDGGTPPCPKCGSVMRDNLEKHRAHAGDAKKRPPAWKCSMATWDKTTKTAGGCNGVHWSETDADKLWEQAKAQQAGPHADPAVEKARAFFGGEVLDGPPPGAEPLGDQVTDALLAEIRSAYKCIDWAEGEWQMWLQDAHKDAHKPQDLTQEQAKELLARMNKTIEECK